MNPEANLEIFRGATPSSPFASKLAWPYGSAPTPLPGPSYPPRQARSGGNDVWMTVYRRVALGRLMLDDALSNALIDANEERLSEPGVEYGKVVAGVDEIAHAQGVLASAFLATLGLESGVDCSAPELDGVLAGSSVAFHADLAFGAPGVLFVVTSILGEGDFVMPDMDLARGFGRGKVFIFDPVEVHGLCKVGTRIGGDVPFVIVSSQVKIAPSGCVKLGMIQEAHDSKPDASFRNLSHYDVHPGTGARYRFTQSA